MIQNSVQVSEQAENGVASVETLQEVSSGRRKSTGNYWLLLFGVFQSLLNAGLIFGWPGLVAVLQREGAYQEKCAFENRSTVLECCDSCEAQQEQLSGIFLVAQSCFSFATLFIGVALDRFGPRMTSSFGTVLVILGLLMMAFSNSKTMDLFTPALSLIAVGGASVHLSWFHISNLFPQHKKTISSLVVGSFALSGLVFVVYEAINQSGLSAKILFLIHAGVNVLCLAGALILWPDQPFTLGATVHFHSVFSYDVLHSSSVANDVTIEKTNNFTQLPISKQMLLPSFLSNLVFFTFNYLSYAFFVATALDQLEAFGDDPNDRKYLKVFSWCLPVIGVASIPLLGWLLDSKGYATGFFFVNTCGVISASLSMVDSLPVQVVRFIAFSVFRLGLFSAMFSFCATNYGFKSFGRLSGLTLFVAAALSLVGLALVNIVNVSFEGNFFVVNVGLLILSLMCYFHPYYVQQAQL